MFLLNHKLKFTIYNQWTDTYFLNPIAVFHGLTDWISVYAISAIFQPYNGGSHGNITSTLIFHCEPSLACFNVLLKVFYIFCELALEASWLLAIMCIGFHANHLFLKPPENQLVFIFNFFNTFPLHLSHPSMVWYFSNNSKLNVKRNHFYLKNNKWGTVRLVIYLLPVVTVQAI